MKRLNSTFLYLLVPTLLLALVGVQIVWLYRAYQIQNIAYEQRINNMLASVAHQLELQELSAIVQELATVNRYASAADSLEAERANDARPGTGAAKYDPKLLKTFDEFLQKTSKRNLGLINNRELLGLFFYHYRKSNSALPPDVALAKLRDADAMLQTIRERLRANLQNRSIARVQMARLDEALGSIMRDNFPTVVPNYELLSDTTDLAPPEGSRSYKAALFANDSMKSNTFLVLHLPINNASYLREILWLLGTSLLIIIGLYGVFAFMRRALNRQKELGQMRNDFINNMTHELKTPIATINLASEQIVEVGKEMDSSFMQRFGKVIFDENIRMRKHVERILDLSQLEKDSVPLKIAPVNLDTILRKAVQQLELQVKDKNARIEYQQYSETSVVQGDEDHLTNVVYNLIDNAIKYSKEAPVVILTTQNEENGLILTVEDNGIGMTPDQQRRIFEKFYRVHTGNVHNVKGFGLGLSYVHRIIDLHGGRISVVSTLGKGSRFTLFIPFQHVKA